MSASHTWGPCVAALTPRLWHLPGADRAGGAQTDLPPILMTWLRTRCRKSSKRLPPGSFKEQLCRGRRALG